MHHLCLLRARLSKLRSMLLEEGKARRFHWLLSDCACVQGKGGAGEGFDVMKSGDSRVCMIGFPSVGAPCCVRLCLIGFFCRQVFTAVDGHTNAVRAGRVRVHDADVHSRRDRVQGRQNPAARPARNHRGRRKRCVRCIVEAFLLTDRLHLFAGKGRGRQVIAVARTSDMVIMMLDAEKAERQKELLTYVRDIV